MLLLLVFDLEFDDVPVKRDTGEERKVSSFSWTALGFLNHVIFAEGTFVPESRRQVLYWLNAVTMCEFVVVQFVQEVK